jgi:hypothetical protein
MNTLYINLDAGSACLRTCGPASSAIRRSSSFARPRGDSMGIKLIEKIVNSPSRVERIRVRYQKGQVVE